MDRGSRGRASGPGSAVLLALCVPVGCTVENPVFALADLRPIDAGPLSDGPLLAADARAVPDSASPADAGSGVDAGAVPDSASSADVGSAVDAGGDPPPSETWPAPGLVGYWRFEEGRGSVAHDSSGMGHDGVLENMGSAPWVLGDSGTGGLSFPGTTSAAVRIKATPAIDAIRTFTIAAWIRRGWQGGPAAHHSVLSRQLGNSNDELFNLSCQQADAVIYAPRNQGQIVQARATVTVAADAWLHLAATYDGSRLLLYQDGTEIARTAGLDVQLSASSTDLFIGTNHNSTLGNEPFLGVLDEVVLFSVALTAKGIQTLARRGSPLEAAAASASSP